jgi:simple sugar transport system permease protein
MSPSETLVATDAPADTTSRPGALRRASSWDGLALLGVLVAVGVVFSIASPNFLTVDNVLNVLQQAAFFGIVALAMTMVIVAGEIDVSVGSSAALSSALLGVLIVNVGVPMWLACLMVLVATSTVGAFAGLMRAHFRVPMFISTLALYLALRGVAMLITSTFSIPIASRDFFYWGSGRLFGTIPVAAVYMLVVFALAMVVTRRTVFGRSVYAVGGNEKAARLSGIRVGRVQVAIMAITGFTAGLTGLLQSAQLASGNPSIAYGLEFDAISAVIIGGASLAGGRGGVGGTLLGVLFIAVLSNGMVLLGVNPYAQNVVRGAVVLVAVLISTVRSKRLALNS